MVKSLILAVLTVGLVQPALAGKTGKAKVSTVKVGSKDGGVAGKLDTALKDAGISGITFKDVLIPDDSNLIGDMTASLTRLDNVVRADASNVAGDGNTQSLIDKLNSVLGNAQKLYDARESSVEAVTAAAGSIETLPMTAINWVASALSKDTDGTPEIPQESALQMLEALDNFSAKMDEESYLALVTRAEELSADKKGARDILGCRQ